MSRKILLAALALAPLALAHLLAAQEHVALLRERHASGHHAVRRVGLDLLHDVVVRVQRGNNLHR